MNPEVKGQVIPPERVIGYQRIFVAVDYLDLTPKVFDKALELAQTYGSQMMIFHTVQGELPGVPTIDSFANLGAYSGAYYQEVSEFYAKAREEAVQKLVNWLRGFVERAAEVGIQAEFDYKFGEPGPQACAMAKNWGADLMIIGRRGRAGLSELLLGSVSNYIVHHAPCSVLIVQH